jgi:hypothetical protein
VVHRERDACELFLYHGLQNHHDGSFEGDRKSERKRWLYSRVIMSAMRFRFFGRRLHVTVIGLRPQ